MKRTIGIFVGYFDPKNLSALPRSVYEVTTRLQANFNFVIFTNGVEEKVYYLNTIKVYQINSSLLGMFKIVKKIIINESIDLAEFYGSLLGGIVFSYTIKSLKIPILLHLYDKKAELSDFSKLNVRYS